MYVHVGCAGMYDVHMQRYHQCSDDVQVTVLLFLPQPVLPFHSSAVMASAMETVSLLYRSEHSAYSLPSLCDALTPAGRKVDHMTMM